LRTTKEHLLVLYYETELDYQEAISQVLQAVGKSVVPENPYGIGKSETFEDPDGYRIVLFNGKFA
jgi:predicted enzyme related to lactoylglutathione lyase